MSWWRLAKMLSRCVRIQKECHERATMISLWPRSGLEVRPKHCQDVRLTGSPGLAVQHGG